MGAISRLPYKPVIVVIYKLELAIALFYFLKIFKFFKHNLSFGFVSYNFGSKHRQRERHFKAQYQSFR